MTHPLETLPPTQTSMTVDEFADRVDQACTDLPEPTRRRLLADLHAHLEEIAEHGGLVDTIGSPEQYARELREALELPPATQPGREPLTSEPAIPAPARRRPRWLIPLVGAAAAILVAIVILATVSTNSGDTAPAPIPLATAAIPTVSIPSPAPAAVVTVPLVVATSSASAVARLQSAGLQVVTSSDYTSLLPVGTVITQMPPAGTEVLSGSTVTIVVSG
jgi:hypothetical protein